MKRKYRNSKNSQSISKQYNNKKNNTLIDYNKLVDAIVKAQEKIKKSEQEEKEHKKIEWQKN